MAFDHANEEKDAEVNIYSLFHGLPPPKPDLPETAIAAEILEPCCHVEVEQRSSDAGKQGSREAGKQREQSVTVRL